MSKSNETDDKKIIELLDKEYSQAWDLYKHEDDLSETRNSRFRTISTAFFGLIGAFASFFVSKIDQQTSLESARYMLLSYASICLILSIIIIVLIFSWFKVNNAAMVYTGLRFEVAENIEEKLKQYYLGNGLDVTADNIDDYLIAKYEKENKPGKIGDLTKLHLKGLFRWIRQVSICGWKNIRL